MENTEFKDQYIFALCSAEIGVGGGKWSIDHLRQYAKPKGDRCLEYPIYGESDFWPQIMNNCLIPLNITPIETFEDALECFNYGKESFNKALKYFTCEEHFLEHIHIKRDIVQLYAAFSHFEENRDRLLSLHQRCAAILEECLSLVRFNAHPRLMRQLLFDLGSAYESVLDVRINQNVSPQDGERPLSEKDINELIEKTQSFYYRFSNTWKDPKDKKIPEKLEEESRLPFFRALMMLANLQAKYYFNEPKGEFDNLQKIVTLYEEAIDFATRNPMEPTALRGLAVAFESIKNIKIAQQMFVRIFH